MRRPPLCYFTSTAALACACILLSAAPAQAVTTYNDGAVHVVNAASDNIEIRDGAGNAPTTVNVQAGAVIGQASSFSINVFNNSILNLLGGDVEDELFLFDNASAQISGGQIGDDITTQGNSTAVISNVTVDDDLEARGTSLMTIHGGSFDEDIESFENAVVNVHGGMFQVGPDGGNVQAAENSIINIYGGTFGSSASTEDGGGGIIAGADDGDFTPPLQPGVVNLYGGNVTGQMAGLQAIGFGMLNVHGFSGTPQSITSLNSGVVRILGGPLQNLTAGGDADVKLYGIDGSLTNIAAQDTVTITIYGTNFAAFNGAVPLAYGPIAFGSGNLSGILADGTPLTNVPFIRNFGAGFAANIVLAQVPEPATAALAVFGLIGLVAGGRRIGR